MAKLVYSFQCKKIFVLSHLRQNIPVKGVSYKVSQGNRNMEHQELLALKLQMGIAPATQIEPDILKAMWQQLKIESSNLQGTQSDVTAHPNPLTFRSVFV